MNGEPDILRMILQNDSSMINELNEEMKTCLFVAVEANNPLTVALLLQYNADYEIKDKKGLIAFDYIKDIDEWLKMDCFQPKHKALFKGK
jgi:ankyrin repeat protein